MKLFFAFAVLLIFNLCFAQDTTGKPPSCLLSGGTYCNFKLCDTCTLPSIFDSVTKVKGVNYGKYYHSSTYSGDVTYKDENTPPPGCRDTAITTEAICTTDSTGMLRYDIYYPSNYTKAQYISCPLPAVIFVHGGGFSDCHLISKNGDAPEGIAFAQRGFVFFNVEYRNGVRLVPNDFPLDPNTGKPYITVQQQLAEYRASQDVRGAIRSIIQRQLDQDSLPNAQKAPYQIDLNNIFLGGNSAGSITVLNAAYYPRQSMIDSINPHAGSVNIRDALGPINADNYYGDTTIAISSRIKGILAQWGCFNIPRNFDSTNAYKFFDQRIPIICFHGLKDNVVDPYVLPVNFAPFDGSPSNHKDTFLTEKTCLLTPSFTSVGNNGISPDIYTYGSPAYYKYILQPLQIRSELYLDCDAMHGLRNNGPFKSDYGTGYSTPDSVTIYIIGRAATFFQNIIGNSMQTTHRVFVECRNDRVTCLEPNHDAGCLNNDNCDTHPH